MDTFTALNHLTPAQHSALYARARREAIALRDEAIRDAASWLVARSRGLWHRVMHAGVVQRSPKVSPCSG